MIGYLQEVTLPSVIIFAVTLLAGVLIGAICFKKEIKISYISQSELLELEAERLEKQDSGNRQLFYGKPSKAIKLIEAIQIERSTGSNIVLLSEKAIYGKNVKSISKEVYQELCEMLSEATSSKIQKQGREK
jgi:hypothetical protein